MVGIKEMSLKVDPSLVGCIFSVPTLVIIKEHAIVADKSEDGVDDLLIGESLVSSVCHFGALFDLVDEHFKRGVGFQGWFMWVVLACSSGAVSCP